MPNMAAGGRDKKASLENNLDVSTAGIAQGPHGPEVAARDRQRPDGRNKATQRGLLGRAAADDAGRMRNQATAIECDTNRAARAFEDTHTTLSAVSGDNPPDVPSLQL